MVVVSHGHVRVALAACVFIVLAGLLSVTARSAQAAPDDTVRLSRFSATPGPVRLTDVANGIDLFVPLASTMTLTDAVIDLRFSHSIALQPVRSYLMVRFNETSLAQVPFNPAQPMGSARVRLPAELWRHGFNKLTLAVVQHYADRCEDPEAPELWTEVDLHASTLTYNLEPAHQNLTLSDLAGLFSPGLGGAERVLLMTASETGGVVSNALPLVAQALALRRQFATLIIDHAALTTDVPPDQPDSTPLAALADLPSTADRGATYLPAAHAGAPHVLIGTAAELSAVLPAGALDRMSGPHLAIERLPPISDSDGRVLVPAAIRLIVTGATEDDVVSAARALSEMDDLLNPVESLSVLDREVAEPNLSLVHGRVLQGDRAYTFAAAGTPTTTVEGFGSHRVRVNVTMPPDFYTIESAKAELLLDFNYGAGMGPGAVMNVKINGEFIHGLLLDAPGGTAFQGYRIALPARRLLPGANFLDFDITLRPQQTEGECAGIKGRHLVAQILGTSTLTLPAAGAVATQPNLALFSATGYPYVAPAHRSAGVLAVAAPEHLGSALTLVGKLAQVAGAPQEGWRLLIGLDTAAMEGRALVLATPEALPADLFESWSAAVGRTVRWPYRALNDLRAVSLGTVDGLIDAALGRPTGAIPTGPRLSGSVSQDGGLGPMGAMAAFRNPYGSEAATLTVITAATPALLDARVADLVTPQVWGQVSGDLMVWRGIEEPVVTLRVANHFEIGDQDRWLLLRLVLSNNPWYWVGAVLVAALVMAFASRVLLRRRRERLENE